MKVEISLPTLKLKERIISYLEERYRRLGVNDAVSWRGIWIELGSAEEEFCQALEAAAEEAGEQGIVFVDADHIRLKSKSSMANKLAHVNNPSLNAGASEQGYGRASNMVRLFLQFVKNENSSRQTP